VCEKVFRPLAHPLVLLFARLRVPPPVVVVAAGAAGIAAAVQLGRGSFLAAALLVQLKTLLDNADGQLARLTGKISAFGRYLDSEVDLLVNVALFVALAWTTGRPTVALAGFFALTSVLSLNFNVERLSRAAGAEPEAEGPATSVLRRIDAARRVRVADRTRTPDRLRVAGACGGRRNRARASPAARAQETGGSRVNTNVFELPAHDSEAARDLTPADWARLEQNAAEIFEALGLDLDTPGTRDTPRRFVRALFDATAGYDGDPKLRTVFPAERPEGVEGRHAQIVEGPVGFYALCEHHALPFHGRAYIGYVAGDEILGISKLTRLVRLYARRFTVQERIAEEIADGLRELAGARGVAVRLEAAHMCTAMRGVEEDGSLTVTTVWRGLYDESDSLRAEFLTLTR
jgi:GTP cyclohydrolase I